MSTLFSANQGNTDSVEWTTIPPLLFHRDGQVAEDEGGEEMKALHFVCPACGEYVKPFCAIWEKGEMRLVADCDNCKEEHIRFSSDSFTSKLLELNYTKQTGAVH